MLRTAPAFHGQPIRTNFIFSCMVGFRTQSLHIITHPGLLYAHVSCDLTVFNCYVQWITPDFLSYSGDALRSFSVQPSLIYVEMLESICLALESGVHGINM